MAPIKLQARSNSVAQIAAGKAPAKAAPAPKTSSDIVGVDPLLVRALRISRGRRLAQAASCRGAARTAAIACPARTGLLQLL